MSIIRNGSNLPKTFDEAIELMHYESRTVSGREEWGQEYRRGIAFGAKLFRMLENGMKLTGAKHDTQAHIPN